MHTSKTSGLLGLALGTCCATTAAQEWPMYQANASHTGAVPNVIRVDSVALNWSRRISTLSLNPVTAADGKVFATGIEKILWCVDAATGDTSWSKDFPTAYSVNPPSYGNGRVYVQTGNHSSDTYLRCYDAQNGNVFFRAPHGAQWERYYAPTIYDGEVYVNGGTYGGMYGFDGGDGRQMWFLQLAQEDQWTPAVDEDYCYAYVEGTISVVHRATGTLAYSWRDTNAGSAFGMNLAPVLGGLDDLIVVQGGRLVRFDLRGRSTVFDIDNSYAGQPAVDGEVIYAIASGALEARSQIDGSLLWDWSEAGQRLAGNVIATGAHIVVASANKTFLIDRDTHQSVYDYAAGGHVAIADNAIYVASSDGTLTSLGFRQLPNPERVTPGRAHYDMVPASITIEGSAFEQGQDLRVWIGGVEATSVAIIDDAELTCAPPDLGPGVFDVRLENSLGTLTLERGFVYHPTLELPEATEVGGRVVQGYQVRTADHVLAMIGVPHPPVRFPPFAGAFELELPVVVAFAAYWPNDEFRFVIPIPDDAALRGVRLSAQGFTVPNHPRDHQGAFSDAETFTIQ